MTIQTSTNSNRFVESDISNMRQANNEISLNKQNEKLIVDGFLDKESVLLKVKLKKK